MNESIIKFLGLEQCLKNSLITLPIIGVKGVADFDSKGKSEQEIMRFCQAFMNELYRHIGHHCNVLAGDIGVGRREIGYLFGQYKKIKNEYTGVLIGKDITFGGSLVRTEATGYGLCYFTEKVLKTLKNDSMKGKRVVISGAGNVAIYAVEKAIQLGTKILTLSDSNGWIYDENGIDLGLVKQIKLVQRGRIKGYLLTVKTAKYVESKLGNPIVWSIPCDIALPCATKNELTLEDEKALVKNGVVAVCEGANMPSILSAALYFIQNDVIFGSAKAADAGGVATSSALEMSQNSMRLSWAF